MGCRIHGDDMGVVCDFSVTDESSGAIKGENR